MSETEVDAAAFEADLLAVAQKAQLRLEGAGPEDTDAVASGLRDALDVGLLLQKAADRGVEFSWAACVGVEALLRAAAKTYPDLASRERKTLAEDHADAPLFAALSSRSLNAQRKLTKGLEAIYRDLIDAQGEK